MTVDNQWFCSNNQCPTFAPADDVIDVGRNSSPEGGVAGIPCLRVPDLLLKLAALIEPPELSSAEKVGLPIVGPNEGSIHFLHQQPPLGPHSPVGQGPGIAVLDLCVSEHPVLRTWPVRGEGIRSLFLVIYIASFVRCSPTCTSASACASTAQIPLR